MKDTLKSRIMALALNKKILLGSSFLVMLSVFMPWYSDIDQFDTGYNFLGITGPMYLAGLLILSAGAVSFAIVMREAMGRPAADLPVENKYVHIIASGFSVLMVVLILSVYFHPKFGINLIDKSAGIGMGLGFIGMMGMLGGAMMRERVKAPKLTFEEELESVDMMERSQRRPDVPETHQRPEDAYSAPIEDSERVPTIEELTEHINNTSDTYGR